MTTQAHVNSRVYSKTILPIDNYNTAFLAHYDISATDIHGLRPYGSYIEDSTVMHYTTDRTAIKSGTTYVIDQSKGSHYGTLVDTTIEGGAFVLNGTSSYIRCINGIGRNNVFSIEFWMQENSSVSRSDVVCFDNGDSNASCRIEKSATGVYGWYGNGVIASGTTLFTHDGTTMDHIVFTCDGTTVKCYKNNTETFSGTMTSFLPETEYINIGKRVTNVFWKGSIRMFAIHNKALTATEVKKRYMSSVYSIIDGGKFDKCMSIDGTQGTVIYDNPISGSRMFTISFWMKVNALGGCDTNTILSINNYGTSIQEIVVDIYRANGTIRMFTYNDSGALSNINGPVCSMGAWTHCAFVREIGRNVMYINGSYVGEIAASTYSLSNGAMRIGSRAGATDMYVQSMYMDELRIDTASRSADEIRQWYLSEVPFYPQGIERMV